MITLTKEWLQQTIAELEEERDATPGAVNEDAAMALAAMKLALASLEAEPVAWRYRTTDINGNPKPRWSFSEDASLLGLYQPLYSAPPVPVSVPDEATRENIEILASTYAPSGITNQWDRDECNAAADSWYSCRAAMHQGAEQTNYRAIVERIAEIIHGKVTDIDLLTVTVKSMKDKLQK